MVHFRQHPGYGRVVSVPDDFRANLPASFEYHVGRSGAVDEEKRRPDGVWVEVEGGGIPVPLLVRIDRTPDDRFVITGLLIGRDEHREITWSMLRQIKPASIIGMLFAGWDPRLPEKLVDETWTAPTPWLEPTPEELAAVGGNSVDLEPFDAEPGSPEAEAADRHYRDTMRALVAHDVWRKIGGRQRSEVGATVEEVTRPRASVATNLTEFAEIYRRNYAADPRRATAATVRELEKLGLPASRATVVRRIAECRDLGLIPPKEKKP